MRKRWFPNRSDELSDGDSQKSRPHASVGPPGNPEPSASHSAENKHEKTDDPVPDGPGRDIADGGEPRQVLDSLRWQFGQAADSLATSALAVLVILVVNLIQPGHTKPSQVFGSVPLYVAGVAIFFRIERRGHRRRRARLPLDMSGGGRFALLLAALALCYVGDVDTHGHAGWLAYAALILGSMSDGAWIALVASRRRIGFWRAWYEVARRHRAAQSHCWAALIGQDHP